MMTTKFADEYDQYANQNGGTTQTGFICTVPLIDSHNPFSIESVTAIDNTTSLTETVVGPVASLDVLTNYLETEDAPSLAYFYASGTLYIYFGNTKYNYDSNPPSFVFSYKRNAMPLTDLTDYLDIPPDTVDWLVEQIKVYLGDSSKRQEYKVAGIARDYVEANS